MRQIPSFCFSCLFLFAIHTVSVTVSKEANDQSGHAFRLFRKELYPHKLSNDTTMLQSTGEEMWAISQGTGCVKENSTCITSFGYPNHYLPYSACDITVRDGLARLIQFVSFDTESRTDYIQINGEKLSGSNQKFRDKSPSHVIKWRADGSQQGSGWKICLKEKKPDLETTALGGALVPNKAFEEIEIAGIEDGIRSCDYESLLQDSPPRGASMPSGSPLCKCVGVSDTHGKAMLTLNRENVTYPSTLGSYCRAWDDGRYPGHCENELQLPGKGNSWCAKEWCFVDPCECELENLPSRASFVGGASRKQRPLYYSYATCSTDDDQLSFTSFGSSICSQRQDPASCAAMATCGWSDYAQLCFRKEMLSTCDGKPDQQIAGLSQCPCIGLAGLEGKLIMVANKTLVPYPLETGGTCDSWDNGRHPDCLSTSGINSRYCMRQWCFVDPCNCRIKEKPRELRHGLSQGRRVFVSYETCGSEIDPNTQEVFANMSCRSFGSQSECAEKSLQHNVSCTWRDNFCYDLGTANTCYQIGNESVDVIIRFTLFGIVYNRMGNTTESAIKGFVMQNLKNKLGIVARGNLGTAPQIQLVRSPAGVKVIVTTQCPNKGSILNCKSSIEGPPGDSLGDRVLNNISELRLEDECLDVRGNLATTSPSFVSAGAVRGQLGQDANDSPGIVNVVQPTYGSIPQTIILVGTPPVPVRVVFQTGADGLLIKSLLTVRNFLTTKDRAISNSIEASAMLFDETKSSTYSKTSGSGKSNIFPYDTQVVESTSGRDVINVARCPISDFPVSQIVRENSYIFHAAEGIFGVLGLAHLRNSDEKQASAFSKLRGLGAMYSFGYCLMNAGKNLGVVVWSDSSTQGVKVPVVGLTNWAIAMNGLGVSGKNLKWDLSDRVDFMAEISESLDYSARQDDLFHVCSGGVDLLSANTTRPDNISADAFYGSEDEAKKQCIENKSCAGIVHRHVEPGLWRTCTSRPNLNQTNLAWKSKLVNSTAVSLCEEGCAVTIDTGSNVIAGPRRDLMILVKTIDARLDCSNFDTLGDIVFNLGGHPFRIPSQGYMLRLAIAGAGGGNGYGANASSWKNEVQRLQASGIDLRLALGVLEGWNLPSIPENTPYICIPAVAPITANSQYGPLWVIGRPIFVKYYARFSWERSEEKPSISFAEVKQAETCVNVNSQTLAKTNSSSGISGSLLVDAKLGANDQHFDMWLGNDEASRAFEATHIFSDASLEPAYTEATLRDEVLHGDGASLSFLHGARATSGDAELSLASRASIAAAIRDVPIMRFSSIRIPMWVNDRRIAL